MQLPITALGNTTQGVQGDAGNTQSCVFKYVCLVFTKSLELFLISGNRTMATKTKSKTALLTVEAEQ